MDDAKRVTLSDVAAASGVSRATVSFVLRNSPDQSISPATRERVRQAAPDLGYVPHGIARALLEGSSRIVVLTLDAALEGHYARSYIHGLDSELAEHDHVLLVRYEHPSSQWAKPCHAVGRTTRNAVTAVSQSIRSSRARRCGRKMPTTSAAAPATNAIQVTIAGPPWSSV